MNNRKYAIKNLKIDKVVVWDNGSNDDGAGATGNFIDGLLSLPAYDELYKMTGNKLPALLNVEGDEVEVVENLKKTMLASMRKLEK